VREIVIVIADLYLAPGQTDLPPGAGALDSLPGLEHAARFGRRRSIEGEGGWRPWLARWLGRDDLAAIAPAVIAAAAATRDSAVTPPAAAATRDSTVMPPATAATRDSTVMPPATAPSRDSAITPPASPATPGGTAWIATPVHLIAGLTSLHLDRRSILRLPPTDCESFANDFNRTFAGSDLLLKPLPSGDFLLQGPATLTGSTTEPARALVADLEASLPKGADSKPLKRLGAELEMWLHATPLNETRQRRGELPVSALWLWGGGPHATAAMSVTRSPQPQTNLAFGTDPYFAGLTHLLGIPSRALPDQLNSILGDDPYARRAVLVAEVTPMLQSNPRWTLFEVLAELDRRLISPALTALRGGTLESVILIANDAELRLGRRDHLRFWRRRQSTLLGLQPP
jgi:hypothetical protein